MHPVSCEQAERCPACDQTDGVELTSSTARVEAWRCTRCGTAWACSLVNPNLRAALSIVGLLPTPQQRTAALLAVIQAEVTRRSGKEQHTMAVSVCFPVDQVVQFDAMATVDTTLWRCRICGQEGTARTTPQATDDAIAHLGIHHAWA